jgi:hypothetical protein
VAHTVILATQEAEIKRIMVQSQPRQIVPKTLSGKNSSQKQTDGVTQGVGLGFKPQYCNNNNNNNCSGCSICGWHLDGKYPCFFFYTLNILFHSVMSCEVYSEKYAHRCSLVRDELLFIATFKIPCLPLTFDNFIIICLGVIFSGLSILEKLKLHDSGCPLLSQELGYF